MASQKRVLFISHDTVGPRMAGPGIRYFHLARVLAQHASVTLAAPAGSQLNPSWPFATATYTIGDWPSIAGQVAATDICVLPSAATYYFPQLLESDTYRVIDGYDPLMAEWLASQAHRADPGMLADWQLHATLLHGQYLGGDFYICASERQRDWWLGLLEANGRLNPPTYRADPSLRSLVDVVAYGLPPGTPKATRSVVKNVWPGIGMTDKVILWGGGLWPWLDPLTAIRAVARLWERRQDIRLIFPGTVHPNPIVASMPNHNVDARAEAERLGLMDRGVFFGEWIAYEDWPNVLLESDLALSLHFDTLETRLAFRSRVLEYIWAGVPIVATRGDATSELVSRFDLGHVVEYGDVEGVSKAIEVLLAEPAACRAEQFQHAREMLAWERVAQPLIDFCQEPYHAADRETLSFSVGAPYYQGQLDRLRSLVTGYENGRFMRTMRRLRRLFARGSAL